MPNQTAGLPILTLVGRPSNRAIAAVAQGLPAFDISIEVACFASFAPVPVPVGTTFDWAFHETKPELALPVRCRLVGATQQYGKSWNEIPMGWRTLCLLRFVGAVPDIIQTLCVVDSWSQGTDRLCLCDQVTLQLLQGQAGD